MLSKQRNIDAHHLLQRAGFGKAITEPETFPDSREAQVNQLLADSRRGKELSKVKFRSAGKPPKFLNPAERMAFRQQQRRELTELNHAWLRQLATEKAQLREKMTLFWHGHFACAVDHPFAMQDLNNLMRRHALGNFYDLTLAVARHPAMLQYLNNRQNRKRSPNENFARELMELFTIGRGHYTETDVKEAARAFTGWNFNAEGEFVFRARQHDFGSKTFRGKTGNWNGEDIIRMLLADPQTAHFLATKLFRFFVNDIPEAAPITELAQVLYQNNYDMTATMRHLFLADWFWAPENRLSKIKSPVELIAGLMRTLNMTLSGAEAAVHLQDLLGQILFRPPNVAGWRGGRAWIDSSTMLLRMNLPRALLLSADPDLELPQELMQQAERQRALKKLRKIGAKIKWKPIQARYANLEPRERMRKILRDVLPGQEHRISESLLMAFTDPRSPESHVRTLFLQILSLPEFQLS